MSALRQKRPFVLSRLSINPQHAPVSAQPCDSGYGLQALICEHLNRRAGEVERSPWSRDIIFEDFPDARWFLWNWRCCAGSAIKFNVCSDQQKACMKNCADPTCKTEYQMCMKSLPEEIVRLSLSGDQKRP
jgi:hypothetical protein